MNKIELRKRTPEERAAYAEGFAAGYQKGLEPQTVILRTTLLLYKSEYDERCERWAEYAAACQELRDRRQDYMKTWCFESGRDRGRTQKLRNQQRHRASKNR